MGIEAAGRDVLNVRKTEQAPFEKPNTEGRAVPPARSRRERCRRRCGAIRARTSIFRTEFKYRNTNGLAELDDKLNSF